MTRIIYIIALVFIISHKADCQSQFQTEADLVEYLEGTWQLDVMQGGIAGITQYFDSVTHIFVFDASEDNQTLRCQSFINDTLVEETMVDVQEYPAQIELPRWQLFNLPENLGQGANVVEELGFYGFSQDTMVLSFNLGSDGFDYGLTRLEGSSTTHTREIVIEVFPNPTFDLLKITFQDYLPIDSIVVLYDTLGELVMTQELRDGTNQLDLSDLAAGSYLYEIRDQGVSIIGTGKIVKL